MIDRFLPGVPGPAIEEAYNASRGNEIKSGKFDNPKSSAALVANAFGFFLNKPKLIPPLPDCERHWPVQKLTIEKVIKFPWNRGTHPHLDCVILTSSALIGIESKRYEPFRSINKNELSEIYWRDCWGDEMCGFKKARDTLNENSKYFLQFDAAQLFKHAFALRTEVHRNKYKSNLKPILFYIYAEPENWPDGRKVNKKFKEQHAEGLSKFAKMVEGDEVQFLHCSYNTLLQLWDRSGNTKIQKHLLAVKNRYLSF